MDNEAKIAHSKTSRQDSLAVNVVKDDSLDNWEFRDGSSFRFSVWSTAGSSTNASSTIESGPANNTYYDLTVDRCASAETQKAVLKGLVCPDPEIRLSALHSLFPLGDLDSIPALSAVALWDSEEQMRAQAAWMLGQLGAAETASTLMECLHDRSALVINRAVEALGYIKSSSPEVLRPKLERMAVTADPQRKVVLAGTMLKLDASSSFATELLVDLVTELNSYDHSKVRSDACQLLGDYPQTSCQRTCFNALLNAALYDGYQENGRYPVREIASESLGRAYPEFTSHQISLLLDQKERIPGRSSLFSVLAAVAKNGSEDLIEPVIAEHARANLKPWAKVKLLGDMDALPGKLTLDFHLKLLHHSDHESIDFLKKRLAHMIARSELSAQDVVSAIKNTWSEREEQGLIDPDHLAKVQINSIRCLGAIAKHSPEVVIPSIVDFLSNQSPQVRQTAVDILRLNKAIAAHYIEELAILLKRPNPETQLAALYTLKAIGTEAQDTIAPTVLNQVLKRRGANSASNRLTALKVVALNALFEIGGEQCKGYVGQARNDTDPGVSRLARRLYSEMRLRRGWG